MKSIRNKVVWVTLAYRFGDPSLHCYVVGVFTKKQAAFDAAVTEEIYRGWKYYCTVEELEVNSNADRNESRVVRPLPRTAI